MANLTKRRRRGKLRLTRGYTGVGGRENRPELRGFCNVPEHDDRRRETEDVPTRPRRAMRRSARAAVRQKVPAGASLTNALLTAVAAAAIQAAGATRRFPLRSPTVKVPSRTGKRVVGVPRTRFTTRFHSRPSRVKRTRGRPGGNIRSVADRVTRGRRF